mmetsp:Transcript_71195/g.153531  ORF Transcript_71195/g.153531 Transcript_71195/m.153531 type:complete len:301 (+) Transcript_71195:892-1794(+)
MLSGFGRTFFSPSPPPPTRLSSTSPLPFLGSSPPDLPPPRRLSRTSPEPAGLFGLPVSGCSVPILLRPSGPSDEEPSGEVSGEAAGEDTAELAALEGVCAPEPAEASESFSLPSFCARDAPISDTEKFKLPSPGSAWSAPFCCVREKSMLPGEPGTSAPPARVCSVREKLRLASARRSSAALGVFPREACSSATCSKSRSRRPVRSASVDSSSALALMPMPTFRGPCSESKSFRRVPPASSQPFRRFRASSTRVDSSPTPAPAAGLPGFDAKASTRLVRSSSAVRVPESSSWWDTRPLSS